MTKIAVLVLASVCHSAGAADLFSRWAVRYETELGAGYDTNVYGTRSGEVDAGYANLMQSVTLSRKNGLTAFDLNANLSATDFFSENDADFVDGGLVFNAAYPADTDDVTFWNASAHWNRTTEVDLGVGRRLQPEQYGAKIGGEWRYSAKGGVTGSLAASTIDRSNDGLSSSKVVSLKTGISHAWMAEGRWSAEYRLRKAETDATSQVESTHQLLGIRGYGRLSPKIKGDAFVGVRRSEFSGAYESTNTRPTLSADLTWTASQQLAASLLFDSDYYFAANGAVVLRTESTVKLKRELGRGFRVSASAGRGYSRYDYEADSESRSDRYWRLRSMMEYAFTQRFYAQLSLDWIDSVSSVAGNDLSWGTFGLKSGLRY